MRGAGAFQTCDMTAFLEIVFPTPGAHPGAALIMRINNAPLTGLWGHRMSPAQCLAHSGRSNQLVVPSPSHRVSDGATPVALNYADDLQVVEGVGEIKGA